MAANGEDITVYETNIGNQIRKDVKEVDSWSKSEVAQNQSKGDNDKDRAVGKSTIEPIVQFFTKFVFSQYIPQLFFIVNSYTRSNIVLECQYLFIKYPIN